MMAKVRKHKRHLAVIMLSMFVLCLGVLTFTSNVKADGEVEDQSLYARMNYIMQYVNEVTAPVESGTPEGAKLAKKSDVGDAGAFIGYCDEAEEGVVGWISSRLSMSSMSYTYNQFIDFPVGGNNVTQNVYYYARYGYTLAEMGLDSTSPETSFAFGRMFGGSLLMLAYVMSLMVPFLLNCEFTFLKILN